MATINFAAPYQHPIHATLRGQPVRLLAVGDVEGQSPSFQYCDQNGKIDWASQSSFTITDQEALPSGVDVMELYQRATTNGSSGRQPVGASSRS